MSKREGDPVVRDTRPGRAGLYASATFYFFGEYVQKKLQMYESTLLGWDHRAHTGPASYAGGCGSLLDGDDPGCHRR